MDSTRSKQPSIDAIILTRTGIDTKHAREFANFTSYIYANCLPSLNTYLEQCAHSCRNSLHIPSNLCIRCRVTVQGILQQAVSDYSATANLLSCRRSHQHQFHRSAKEHT